MRDSNGPFPRGALAVVQRSKLRVIVDGPTEDRSDGVRGVLGTQETERFRRENANLLDQVAPGAKRNDFRWWRRCDLRSNFGSVDEKEACIMKRGFSFAFARAVQVDQFRREQGVQNRKEAKAKRIGT